MGGTGVSLAPGQTVAHYRLIEKIGEGGMGVVWKAEDLDLGRAVALKVLPEGFAGHTRRAARFEQEARMLAALNHPNIATVHGFERAGDVRMLVMEYVDGADVASRLAEGPSSFERALPLFEQMAEALQAAHERGIVHRDLKPANIKITPAGRVKVLDFGLAKALGPLPGESSSSGSPTRTREGTRHGLIVGTANYMSPEQLRGLELDGRSDLFQLGLVFFQMLTGRHPFDGPTSVDVQHAILHDSPHAASFPSAPPEFSRLLAKLLEKNRDYRYPDARALLVDLRTLRRDSLSGVGSADALGVGPARSSRRGVAIGLVAGVALVAVLALVLGRLSLRAPHAAVPDRLVPLLDSAGSAADPSFSPDGGRVVFASDRDGDWDLWIALIAGGDPVRITDTSAAETGPVFSPDGTAIAFARTRPGENGSDLYVMPALGGAARKLADDAESPSWSPDGGWIAYADNAKGWTRIAKVAPDDPDHPVALTDGEVGFFEASPSWSPDGRWIVFTRSSGGASGRLWRMRPDGSERERIMPERGAGASSHPVVSPDGRFVVYSSDRGGATNVWRVPLRGGEPERITSGPGPDTRPAVSSDGSRIVFVNESPSPRIVVFEPGRGTSVLAQYEGGFAWGPRLSPDGQTIAFARKVPGRSWQIWLMPRTGGAARSLLSSDLDLIWPRFGPDGGTVLFFNWNQGNQRVGRVGLDGRGLEWLTEEGVEAGYPDISPDGKLLACVRFQGEGRDVVVRSLATGEERVLVEDATLPVFSPDGRSVAVARTRSYNGGIGVVATDGGEVRWLTGSGTWPVWMPDGSAIAFADHHGDEGQQAWTVSPAGGSPRRIDAVAWNEIHHPFDIDPRTGAIVTTDGAPGRTTLWLAEYD